MNVNHHSTAIDITDLQMRHFRTACPRPVECHQKDAIERQFRRIDQACHLLRTENLRQANDLPGIGSLGNAPVLLQHLDVEEPQSAKPLDYGVGAELQLAEQHRLVLANMLRAEL